MKIIKDLADSVFTEGKHVVIQPHLDDIPFSLSYFLNTEMVKEKKAYTIFGKEFFNIRDYPHTNATVEILKEEEKKWFDCMGINHERFENEEAGYRGIAKVRELFSPSRFTRFDLSGEDFSGTIYKKVEESIKIILKEKPDYIWIPAGIGGHIDHIMVRLVALKLISQCDYIKNVFLYEEYPYRIYSKQVNWKDVYIDSLKFIGEIAVIPDEQDWKSKYTKLLYFQSQITEQQIESMVMREEKVSVWKYQKDD